MKREANLKANRFMKTSEKQFGKILKKPKVETETTEMKVVDGVDEESQTNKILNDMNMQSDRKNT
jgi:hypothetical protein